MEFKEMVEVAVHRAELEMLFSKTCLVTDSSIIRLEKMVLVALEKMERRQMLRSESLIIEKISEKGLDRMIEDTIIKEELEMLLAKKFLNKKELEWELSSGILVNGGDTWFSSNKNGEHCELISGACLNFTKTSSYCYYLPSLINVNARSRFKKCKQNYLYTGFEAHASTQFLSPCITYTVNLVFKLEGRRKKYDFLRYTIAGETEFSTSFLLHERGDGWMMADHHLCHFICDNKESVDIDITFECGGAVRVEGIEIRSMERVHHEQELDKEEVDRHPDTYWENKLPNDWKEILKLLNDSVRWTRKKELYSILSKGFLINHDQEYFSIAYNGRKCHMLSARKALSYPHCDWKSFPDSRFRETAFDPCGKIHMDCRSVMVSPETTYAAYLVYKLQENHPRFETPVEVYLLSPDQPQIIKGKVYQKKRVPQQRKNGWMEVPIWELQTDTDTTSLKIKIEFRIKPSEDNISFKGLILEGIEFKPV